MSGEKLFDHQLSGASYLAMRERAYLGDPPGFGKTRIAIEAARCIDGARPLVICPAIVRTHWAREFERWAPEMKPVIISYDGIVRGGFDLMFQFLSDPENCPNLLILDEAHYLKHPTAKRTQLILGPNGYARRMPVVWALSGTPTPKNNPMEYWTILSSLFPHVALEAGCATPRQFEEKFCITTSRIVRGRYIRKVVGIQHAQELVDLMGKTMLRRSPKELSFSMPPVFASIVPLDLTQTVEEPEFAGDMVFVDKSFLADPELARYRHNVGDAKAGIVAAWLGDQLAGSTEKVVVFAHHRSVLGALKAYFDITEEVAYIDGDTPQAKRAEEIDRFQTDPNCRVFLGQTIACHTGITLTAASRVVLVEPDWTDSVNVQAAHRVARIGQLAETCLVQYIVAAGTLDEGIIRSLAREAGMGAILYEEA